MGAIKVGGIYSVRGLGITIAVKTLQVHEGVAVGWPVVEQMINKTVEVRVPTQQLHPSSEPLCAVDRAQLQQLAVEAANMTVDNHGSRSFRKAYRREQLKAAITKALRAKSHFRQKVKLGLWNSECDGELFQLTPPVVTSATFELKRHNLVELEPLLGVGWDKLGRGRYVTKVGMHLCHSQNLYATIHTVTEATIE